MLVGLLHPRDPVASVHGVLAASDAPWLLVFDNAPDQESVRAFLPPLGNGNVFITSQNALVAGWPGDRSTRTRHRAAAGFLVARTGDTE